MQRYTVFSLGSPLSNGIFHIGVAASPEEYIYKLIISKTNNHLLNEIAFIVKQNRFPIISVLERHERYEDAVGAYVSWLEFLKLRGLVNDQTKEESVDAAYLGLRPFTEVQPLPNVSLKNEEAVFKKLLTKMGFVVSDGKVELKKSTRQYSKEMDHEIRLMLEANLSLTAIADIVNIPAHQIESDFVTN